MKAEEIKEINGKSYYVICPFDELKHKDGKKVRLEDDEEVAVFRIHNEIFAVSNICPHHHKSGISKGKVKHGVVSCPFHGWEFDIETGKNIDKEGGNLKKYNVVNYNGIIYLEKPVQSKPKWML